MGLMLALMQLSALSLWGMWCYQAGPFAVSYTHLIGKNTGEASSATGLSSAGKSYFQSLQMSGADDATIAKYISNAVKQGIISSADAKILAERYGFGTEYR